jgi:hypothetical protein
MAQLDPLARTAAKAARERMAQAAQPAQPDPRENVDEMAPLEIKEDWVVQDLLDQLEKLDQLDR